MSIRYELILVDVDLSQQPIIIPILLSFIVIICFLGLLSNLVSFLIFIQTKGRQVGSGYYLLILSLISPIALFIMLFRFVFLLINQISFVNNELFLSFGCSILDYLLSFSIALCDWLTACITCERMISIIKGIRFNRKQSIRFVKFILPLLICIFSLGYSHQFVSHQLLTDPRNDARQWCVIKYEYQWIETYDVTFKLINCTIPFVINFTSTIVLLIIYSGQKHRVHQNEHYSIILKTQVRQHKHLILTPLIMIIFKLPLFLTQIFIRCTHLKWQFYVSIIVYICSYIPLTLTFILFVYFSPLYSEIFQEKCVKRVHQWFRKI